MTEHERLDFERRFEQRIARYAAIPVVPVDADAVAARAMRQRRMSGPLQLLLAAALLVILLLVAWLISGGSPRRQQLSDVAPGRSGFPTASATAPAPNASGATPTSAAGPVAVADAARARWIAWDPGSSILGTSSGPIDLTISADGRSLSVGNLGAAGSFASTVVAATPDELTITLDRAAAGCPAGATGVYGTSSAPDGSRMTLTKQTDACAGRAIALGRTWGRSLIGSSTRGAGIVDAFSPAFSITLPDGQYQSRTLEDFFEFGGPSGLDLMVWKDPQGFANPCAQPVRYPYKPGADAVVAYLRQNKAFTVKEATPLEIDGHHAIHLVTEAKADYAPCPSQDLLLWTPKACDCHWIASPGTRDSFYLVDVGTDTIAFELNPVDPSTDESPITESLRIPAQLPGQ